VCKQSSSVSHKSEASIWWRRRCPRRRRAEMKRRIDPGRWWRWYSPSPYPELVVRKII